MKKILSILGMFIEDFFILSGLLIIIITTYRINIIAGSYLLGFVFIVLGVLLAKRGKKPPKN